MSKLIIFCGKSGSGKTTLAQKVATELNIFYLSKDSIKEALYDLYEGKTLVDSNYHGKQSIFLLNALAEENLKLGVDMILEAPFNHPDNIENFKRWGVQYKVDIRIVVCEVPEEIRIERMKARQISRHRSHHDDERFRDGQYNLEDFDYTQMPEPKIFLKTIELERSLKETLDFINT